MVRAARTRAVANYRSRLAARGIGRYEVRGLVQDKVLVRELAKRLAADTAEAARLRKELLTQISDEPRRGGVWEALRRSAAVGADLDLSRETVAERDADL